VNAPGVPLPNVPALSVREVVSDDEPRAQTFSCGDGPWHKDVADYLSRKYWLPGRKREEALIALIPDTDDIFGFGCWKHTVVELPQRPEPLRVIRICYFGVDRRFQGAREPATGQSWAGRLYSTLETVARSHPDSDPSMPAELYCDHRNAQGLAFWQSGRRGFKIVDPDSLAGGAYLQLVRIPTP
jgi:hypothetical protein